MANELAISPTTTPTAPALATTIRGDSPANKLRVFNATSGAFSLASVAEANGLVLDLVDVFQTPGIRKSRSELVPDMPCVNTYLLTKDGTAYMSQSSGIADSAAMLVSDAMFPDCGKSLPDGCLHVVVTSQKLANGNTVKRLVLADVPTV